MRMLFSLPSKRNCAARIPGLLLNASVYISSGAVNGTKFTTVSGCASVNPSGVGSSNN